MQILIDSEEFLLQKQFEDLPSLLSELRTHCSDRDQVITEIRADDQSLNLDHEVDWPPLEEIGCLQLTTQPYLEVAASVFIGCADHLPPLIEGIRESARKMRLGHQAEAMNLLIQEIDLLSEILAGTESALSASGLSWNSVSVTLPDKTDPVPGDQISSRFNLLLEEVVKSLESNDMVDLVDILEYDIAPVLESFMILLRSLAGKCNEQTT